MKKDKRYNNQINTVVEKNKLKVLKYSLRLEKIASHVLAFRLEINDPEESRTLGNSNPLQFSQKINLLIDLELIPKEDKFKFDIFMSIRNQFMHNLYVDTFKDVIDVLDKKNNSQLNKLKGIYSSEFSDDIDIETSLEKCLTNLYLNCAVTLRAGIKLYE